MNHCDVMNDIKTMLDEVEPLITGDQCVYTVPRNIRRLNKKAYTPQFVSIGPLHHRHPKLQNMERHKRAYCKKFLERSETSLDSLIRHIEEIEPRVRCCYSDTVDLSKEEFVKVILVDSAFIIELFLRFFDAGYIFLSKPWLDTHIREDLLLLENQLPFFVLESLFTFISESDACNRVSSFLQLTIHYFKHYNVSWLITNEISSIHHFTDLLRTFHLHRFLLEKPSRTQDSPTRMHLPSAAELVEAGVRFKVNTESDCLLDLRFSGSVLEIPRLEVEDKTETLFRNLVAFEQCHYPYESYITDYVVVLDFLINTSKDVDVLVKNEILGNWLGDTDSVAELFNGLWRNIIQVNFSSDYLRICKDLNAFCRNPWHNLEATLRRDYGNTPWQAATSIGGIILLILTLVQTVFSILQVVLQ